MPTTVLELSKPFFLVKILDKDSGDLKYVWSPNIFMDEERPDDESKIASDTYIEDIEVKSNFQPPINTSELKISHSVGKIPKIVIKDKLSVYFGYYTLGNSENATYSCVYSGEIDFIKASLNHTIIKASSKIKKITDFKRDLTFSKVMTITDIIKKLAITDAGLEEATNGIASTEISKQKGFAISKNMSIYQNLKKLSDFAGFDIYMDVFDKFNAREWSPEDIPAQNDSSGQPLAIGWISERGDTETDVQKQLMHQVFFGINILDMELNIENGGPSNMEIVSLVDSDEGEIFTTEPPVGTSAEEGGGSGGSGGSSGESIEAPEKIVLPRFTKADADKIAKILAKLYSGGLTGTLTLIGAPQIRMGDGIKIKGYIYGKKPFSRIDIPTSDYDASSSTESEEQGGSSSQSSSSGSETTLKIIGIKHIFNDNLGYITKLTVAEAELAAPSAGEGAGAAGAEGAGAGVTESTEAEFAGEAAGAAGAVATGLEEEEEGKEEVDFLTLAGINFNFDSAVVLTRDLGDIRAIVDKVNESEKKVLIAGHTDRMGSEEYNLNLSGLRARSVLAVSTGNRGTWNDVIASGKTKVEDYQAILKDFGFYEGEVDGRDGPKTKEAITDFQTYYNKKYDEEIATDGIIGKETWGAIFQCMVDVMGSKIDDGKFKETLWIGCGEYRPIEKPETDEVESEENRRVEFLLYHDHKFPKISSPYASRTAMEAAYNDAEYDFNKTTYDNVPLDMNLAEKEAEGEDIMFVLGGLDGKPLKNHPYEVTISGETKSGTTSSEGLVTETITDESVTEVVFKWDIAGEKKERTYYIEKDDYDTSEGLIHRLKNLIFGNPGFKDELEKELDRLAEYDFDELEYYQEPLKNLMKILGEEE